MMVMLVVVLVVTFTPVVVKFVVTFMPMVVVFVTAGAGGGDHRCVLLVAFDALVSLLGAGGANGGGAGGAHVCSSCLLPTRVGAGGTDAAHSTLNTCSTLNVTMPTSSIDCMPSISISLSAAVHTLKDVDTQTSTETSDVVSSVVARLGGLGCSGGGDGGGGDGNTAGVAA
jgi:hypothetical protein